MKSTLVLLSLFVIGLRAAPRQSFLPRKSTLSRKGVAPNGIVPHVINGEAQVVQHATVVFSIVNEFGEGFFGGGSIISERHVITGANLMIGAISALVGYGATTLAGLTVVSTDAIVPHPAFNPRTLDNDIALIFLELAITFNDDVRAIALPTAAPTTGLEGHLGGFGYTQANAIDFSDTLLVANLISVDASVCIARFPALTLATSFCANGTANSIMPGLITNICSGDNGAGFYTGDGMITTTEPPEEGDDDDEELTEGDDEELTEGDDEELTEGGDDGTELEGEEADDNKAQLKLKLTDFWPEYVYSKADVAKPKNDNDSTKNVVRPLAQIQEDEQIVPTLIGIASALGNFWECDPAEPRTYTIVFNYLSWIRTFTGIGAAEV